MATALITGSAQRLGRMIAIFLADNGWDITIHYNKSKDEALSLHSEILGKNVKSYLVQSDFLRHGSDITKFFTVSKEPPSLLINNAAVFKNDNISSFDAKNIDTHFDVNLKIPMILTGLFSKQKFSSYDTNINVINILDSDTKNIQTNFSTYYITKAALEYFTKVSAKQLAPKIRVNGIAIGQTIKNDDQSEENFQHSIQETLLRRKVEPTEVLAIINLILSTPSMTGEIITLGSRFL